jgi:hypothetical protein
MEIPRIDKDIDEFERLIIQINERLDQVSNNFNDITNNSSDVTNIENRVVSVGEDRYVRFKPMDGTRVKGATLFEDINDGKLKYKDRSGVIHELT